MNSLDLFLWIVFIGLGLLFLVTLGILLFIISLARHDKKQTQHSIRRNFPVVGWLRYILEHKGKELRQYFFDNDEEGSPYSRSAFQDIVKKSKYAKSIIAFGSKRNMEQPGFYIKNAMFVKQLNQLEVDNSEKIRSKKYVLDKESFWFGRFEHQVEADLEPWLYQDKDAVILGEHTCQHPFVVKSPIGMSGMSFPALGDHAITSLSMGLGFAKSFMNTGEGGLSPYHLKGDVDIICQIGPAKFGFRESDGAFSFEKLKEKAAIEQVKAFELKLGQGAKIRGGHVEGAKVTPEVAEIRGVEPWKTVDSPNRFDEFSDAHSLLQFIQKLREVAQKPIGIKIVVGGENSLDELMEEIVKTSIYPDFISVDGGEGGSGATYKSMADSMGLPLYSGLMILDKALRKYNLRENIKVIASGKLYSADRIAIALSMGADLVQLARGMMISVGCIGAEQCHSNDCPVGVATVNPKLQQALVIDEKKYRACNYVVSLREDLFALAAATGLTSPRHFKHEHVIYRYGNGKTENLKEIMHQKIV